jgi:DNA repair protein RadC
MPTLYVRDASGYREASPPEVLSSAEGLIAQRFRIGAPVLTAPERVRAFLRLHLGALEHEVFGLLHLDNRHRLIRAEDLFRGTLDGALVHPREVVRSVLAYHAAAVILYHNHPSGDSTPSQADELITQRLKEALALIDVRVLDHLIVGQRITSFAELGLV